VKMYAKLGLALALSYVVMFLLSMSMIREWDHFYLNGSNAWMALVMVAPMGLIMIAVMWAMFQNKALNAGLALAFVAVFAGALYLGRQEADVGNEQFLKSMIPHHSRAILVCQEADITDPEIEELCGEIVKTQQEEIAQMKEILERY
jgi:uncharacterized protein (DUF305 family)